MVDGKSQSRRVRNGPCAGVESARQVVCSLRMLGKDASVEGTGMHVSTHSVISKTI
jgi:hypothetical protein